MFSLTDDENLERIENMLYTERDLPENTFISTESRLNDIISRKPGCSDAFLRLAELYNHKIETLTRKAVDYAKQSIRIQPEKKDGHSVMSAVLNGYGRDWTENNTLEMVRYYRGIMKRVPDWLEGWGWLLDQLIGNGLLNEAREVIENTIFKNHKLAKARLGEIAYAEGNDKEAFSLWQECIEDSPDEWRTYAFRADMMVYMGRHEDALKDYASWLEKQPKPRFTDPCICMALIYEELGETEKAIEMRQMQYDILKKEHHFEDGEAYESVMREIERLRLIESS